MDANVGQIGTSSIRLRAVVERCSRDTFTTQGSRGAPAGRRQQKLHTPYAGIRFGRRGTMPCLPFLPYASHMRMKGGPTAVLVLPASVL